ncbi:MAG TPA: hypothetical protein VIA18_21365 [Polyangia bacterium]|jgi:hypothetical protein|nr:hypothetical protein [Polyangia bacterium]
MFAFGLALAGTLLLWLPARRFAIDAATCATWPSPLAGALYGAAYLAAIALLAWAWQRAQTAGWSSRRALVLGAIVHVVALGAPPFASNDPLFYAAIGHAEARYHARASTPLSATLPADDRFFTVLPTSQDWRDGTSPYGPAFDALARVVATLGGDDLTLQLRAYQAINVVVLVATAALAGVAFGAPAVAFVLFCPLAIVDGTINPHNDVWLALAAALFAVAVTRKRDAAGFVALVAALFIKLSASLLVAFDLMSWALRPIARRIAPRRFVLGAAAIAIVSVAAAIIAVRAFPSLTAFAALLGDPSERHPLFSRSFEALPRAALVYLLHLPAISWAIGLVFRTAAAIWIAWCAYCAARDGQILRWAATLLLVYYVLFHAFVNGWYLIPLLPLAPALPAFMRPSLRLFVIALTSYYAVTLPLDCDYRPVVLGTKELLVACAVIPPTALKLLFAWRREKQTASRASAAT